MKEPFSYNNTTHSTPNNLSCASRPFAAPPNPFALFFEVAFGSSIYMIIVAVITVVANSLLLLVFYVDPYKTFRNPTSFFLIALTFVDLITGLVQEPIFASCFLFGYLRHPAKQHCPELLRFGQILSLTTMNASFIIVFAFTATQLIVITSPLKYATLVTKTKIIVVIVMIYGYSITFSLLHLLEFSDGDVLSKVDLFLHSFFVVYVTIAIYTLLYKDFRRKMIFSRSLRSERTNHGDAGRQRTTRVERKFITVNFLLISLVFFCTQPSAFLGLYKHYWLSTDDLDSLIANLIVDNILYLKFMLDPFVYAWRLPKYRRALKMVLCCGSRKNDRVSTLNASTCAQANRTQEAVVLKRFTVVTE